MSRNAKVLCVSTKGGVGKSTISIQLIVPALFELAQHQKVSLYECDDENSDSLSYGASQLLSRNLVRVDTPFLRDDLLELVLKEQPTCIDIGGNKSTTIVLDALDTSGAIHFIDLALIPILDGEQDGLNAIDVYQRLKLLRPELPILFVLNRAKDSRYIEHQFENFFGDVRGIFQNINAVQNYLIDEDANAYLTLDDNEMIKYSRRFGLTVYEIASQERDFISRLKTDGTIQGDLNEAKILSFKHFVERECKNYLHRSLLPAIQKIQSTIRNLP
ncbi:ParA family protein [Sulfuricurvum sp.]|uniref:ParA family protein n=1 Tax=Sulfuricurvum sp. TaxID=2025608 RepID=UPI003BB7C7EF